MDVSLVKLQQLVTVAELGSLSRAAIELNISQPALSRSIAAIENRYGFQIFDRVGHGVQLTTAGAQVVRMAQPLLQELRVFDNNLRMFGSAQMGALVIGLAPLLASELLAGMAKAFFQHGSRAQLQVAIRSGSSLIDSLKKEDLEMVFFPESYIEADPTLEIEQIGTVPAVCLVRAAHPLTQRDRVTLEDLSDFPWASSVVPPILVENLHPAQFTCDNYHILREVVEQSDLICICSRSFVAEQLEAGSLCAIDVEGLPTHTTRIYSARLKGRVISPLAEEAVAYITQQLQQG